MSYRLWTSSTVDIQAIYEYELSAQVRTAAVSHGVLRDDSLNSPSGCQKLEQNKTGAKQPC